MKHVPTATSLVDTNETTAQRPSTTGKIGASFTSLHVPDWLADLHHKDSQHAGLSVDDNAWEGCPETEYGHPIQQITMGRDLQAGFTETMTGAKDVE